MLVREGFVSAAAVAMSIPLNSGEIRAPFPWMQVDSMPARAIMLQWDQAGNPDL
jgi:hypothetical protein